MELKKFRNIWFVLDKGKVKSLKLFVISRNFKIFSSFFHINCVGGGQFSHCDLYINHFSHYQISFWIIIMRMIYIFRMPPLFFWRYLSSSVWYGAVSKGLSLGMAAEIIILQIGDSYPRNEKLRLTLSLWHSEKSIQCH